MTGQAAAHIAKLRTLEGKTRAEAVAALGLCEAYVIKLAKDNGISLAKNPSPADAIVDSLRSLAASGFTMKEAAVEVGVWQQSGKWEQRGRGQGYVMCRNGDDGPYSVDNVYIATNSQNTRDGYLNRGYSLNSSRTQSRRAAA